MIISLKQFNIQRPERVTYEFPISDPADLINYIKSKSLRSFLLKTDEVLAKNNIECKYEDLTEQKFTEWLPYYEEKMKEHGYDILASLEKYQDQIKKGYTMKGIFLYRNKKLVGSCIVGLRDGIANGAYKASDRMTISSNRTSSSLGSIVEFLFLKLAAENGCTMANSRSRNAFGFFNTLGYLDYKLRFGYKPIPSPGMPLLDEVPVNEKGFVLFYGLENGVFTLFALQPKAQKGKELFDKSRFTSGEVLFKEIYY